MAQITLTVDLTLGNLEILKQLIPVATTNPVATAPNPVQVTFDTLEGTEEAKDKKATKKTTQKDKKAATSKNTPTLPEPDVSAISLTDVRAIALKISKAGKQGLLKEIFSKYGAEKLSDISSDNYSALLADLEAANG